jgi:tetratricopeptide (TPR) repeat protein
VSQSFLADLVPLVDQELARRIGPLNAALKADPSPKAYNARGVLYARFNRLTEAEKDFRLATAKTPYAPALINLGNVAFLKQDNLSALAAYQKAAPLVPGNARLQLNLARAAQALGKTSEAAQAVAIAQKLDPDLTARYSPGASATEGNRAAEQGARAPLWDEENRS